MRRINVGVSMLLLIVIKLRCSINRTVVFQSNKLGLVLTRLTVVKRNNKNQIIVGQLPFIPVLNVCDGEQGAVSNSSNLTTLLNTEKRVENTKRSGVFLKKFKVWSNCIDNLIYLLNRN